MIRRASAFLLALVLCLAMCPTHAAAAQPSNTDYEPFATMTREPGGGEYPIYVGYDVEKRAFQVTYTVEDAWFEVEGDTNGYGNQQSWISGTGLDGQITRSYIVGSDHWAKGKTCHTVYVQFMDGNAPVKFQQGGKYTVRFRIWMGYWYHTSPELGFTWNGATIADDDQLSQPWSKTDVIGTWTGRYLGWSEATGDIERNYDVAIQSCDDDGNIEGTAQIVTPGRNAWFNYNFRGKVDMDTGKFHMQGYHIIASDGDNWDMIPFDGTMTRAGSVLSISGIAKNEAKKYFYLSRKSATPVAPVTPDKQPWTIASGWAEPGLHDAVDESLIPPVLIGKDYTLPADRQEFASVGVRLYENLSGSSASAAPSDTFSDTDDPDVLKAYNIGVINGTGNGRFSPGDNLTREQMCVMLTRCWKAANIPGWTLENDANYQLNYDKIAPFADDASISSWAKESVYFLASCGYVNGVGGNRFDPQGTASREQAILVAQRMIGKKLDVSFG